MKTNLKQIKVLVFISYSWDNEIHKEWVLKLADRLEEYHEIDIIFDQYDISTGKDMTFFMERAMTADKILMILTPEYKKKAELRKGGVGFEYSMITAELYDNQLNNKVLPIIRSGNKEKSVPSYIQTKTHLDMTDDTVFNSKLNGLIRNIFDKPLIERPKKKKNINFSENNIMDEVLEKAENINLRIEQNNEIDKFLYSQKSITFVNNEIDKIFQFINDKALFYTDKTKISFQINSKRLNNILIIAEDYKFQFYWKQKVFNYIYGSHLDMYFWKEIPSVRFERNRTTYIETKLFFDLNLSGEIIWRKESSKEVFNTMYLMDLPFKEIITRIIDDKSKLLKR